MAASPACCSAVSRRRWWPTQPAPCWSCTDGYAQLAPLRRLDYSRFAPMTWSRQAARAVLGSVPLPSRAKDTPMQLGRLGVWYSMDKLATAQRIKDFAVTVETLGYDVLWYPESRGFES